MMSYEVFVKEMIEVLIIMHNLGSFVVILFVRGIRRLISWNILMLFLNQIGRYRILLLSRLRKIYEFFYYYGIVIPYYYLCIYTLVILTTPLHIYF